MITSSLINTIGLILIDIHNTLLYTNSDTKLHMYRTKSLLGPIGVFEIDWRSFRAISFIPDDVEYIRFRNSHDVFPLQLFKELWITAGGERQFKGPKEEKGEK